MHAVHLCVLQKNTKTHIFYTAALKAAMIYSIQKTLTFANTVSTELFSLSDKLVPNCRERVDFKQQILDLLLGHH